jgi:transposase
MTYILGHDRSQILLLPEAVDDYVVPDNPVRFIDVFIDGLDLSAASFARVEAKVTGRPGGQRSIIASGLLTAIAIATGSRLEPRICSL